MDAKKIGNRIKLIRKAKGLTQADLAQMVDLTPKYLRQYRTEKMQNKGKCGKI